MAGAHLPLPGLQPVGGEPLLFVTHGQCDARPTVTFPAARLPIGWYQIILFGDRGTCVLTTWTRVALDSVCMQLLKLTKRLAKNLQLHLGKSTGYFDTTSAKMYLIAFRSAAPYMLIINMTWTHAYVDKHHNSARNNYNKNKTHQ